MVAARPYPRENIGNRAYAACKHFLRIVEARSYPRESSGNRAYVAWKYFLRMIQARSYARENVGNRVYAACKCILWMVKMHSYIWETFDTAANSFRVFHNKIFRSKTKKNVVVTCSETSKNKVFDRFLAPRRGEILGFWVIFLVIPPPC